MYCRLYLLVLVAVAVAKKASEPDPDILNPDEEEVDQKHSGEYNTGSKFTEGDMVVKGNKDDRNAINNDDKKWPSGVVPYVIESQLPQSLKDVISRAMADYHKYTCIKWQQRRSEKNYVYFTNRGGGCYAYLGMYGGKQPVNLGRGCESKGIAIHEMLHSLGFAHEQSRNDRDKYIRINWENMYKSMASQFHKMNNERNLGSAYDVKSIMHYGPWGFSSNGKRVIDTVDPKMKNVIGQRQGFSKIDAQEVNKLYNCGSSRPAPTVATKATRKPGDCKNVDDSYCKGLADKLTQDKLCNSGTYAQIADSYCPKYCKLC